MEIDKKTKVLDSLVEITKHKDSELLEISLAKTIYDLFDAAGVSFFRMLEDELKVYSVISVSDAGVSLVLKTEEIDEAARPFLPYFEEIRKTRVMKRISLAGSETEIRPIILNNSVIGFLSIAFPKEKIIDDKVIASFLDVYGNYHNLLVDNQYDTLTGLLNRKTFEEKLYHFMEAQVRNNDVTEPEDSKRTIPETSWGFWLGIFDIDNFKRINDTYGHVYGDEVLISLAAIVKQSFRPMDIKLRFGGEEFIVVIRARDKENAVQVFERFRKNMENHEFGLAGSVTVSIGLVSVTSHEAIVSVVGRADQALYHAKKTGKNRICVYEDLVEQGIVDASIIYGDIVMFD